ncbi:Cytochrome P450 monooxygenase 124 [Psilocybe cubensis]|uniref:Cytochrome P450 monooxygenase 124 n=2 Tax=Psilocybe cubensis TaxID=181762 RepID=A0ACB8HAM3_PSICU|nr:Cytochrome P450 monooxygenase 124 [Psilocybe cubensis]KAH9485050.1 Cytochrome P450 monooxygenase 124 [Psilocybe cubensis]
MHGTHLLVFSFVAVYVCRKLLNLWKAGQSVHNFPGKRLILNPLFNNFVPKIRGISDGQNSLFNAKHTYFDYVGWDAYTSISLWPNTRTMVVLADAAAIKEITLSRARFPKPVHHYKTLSFYGKNIVASEGEEWKKYRKISAPAFSDRNNKLVWDSSIKIVEGLFNDVWGKRDVIEVDHCVDITLPIALFVIGAAGFGRSISWKEDAVIPPGHSMTFKDALHVVTVEIFLKIILPDWAMGLTKRLRRARLAFEELRSYMVEMIRDRQKAEKAERHDLFSSLLAANDHTLDASTLTESELIGNIYIFLVAGHETTAHTLCFTFALLALYPDEQEKLVEHIRSILPNGQSPTYEDMPLLTYSMAVFYETLRMFPPVTGIPKEAAEDTTITVGNKKGEQTTIPIPKGADLTLSTVGLHYNPRYWHDPDSFKPSRFLGDWPRDAFIPFSSGARACIGRKFFETEGIAILTMLVSHYKIAIKEEPQFASESFEQRKARVLSCRAGLTVTPIRVPLTFTRRI